MKFVCKFVALICVVAVLCDLSMVIEHGHIAYLPTVFLYAFMAWASMKLAGVWEEAKKKRERRLYMFNEVFR